MVVYIIVMVSAVSLSAFAAHSRFSGKSTRAALAIILVASLIMPLSELVSSISSFSPDSIAPPEGTDEYNEYIEQAYRSGLLLALQEELELGADTVEITLYGFDASSLSCLKCTVRLYSGGMLADRAAIKNIMKKSGVESCEIILG